MSDTVDLRRRTGTASSSAAAAAAVQPLESTEQERIIREFELDKMKQDSLWKHFLAILYGGTALALTMMMACSLLFGCGKRTSSPLEGSRCTYFALPTVLYELYASFSFLPSSFTSLLVNLTILSSICLICLWAYYSWRMDLVETQQSFNESRSRAKLTTTQLDESSSPIPASSTSPPPLPISPSTWQHLKAVQTIAEISIVAWLIFTIAITVARFESFGVILPLFLLAPLFLAGLTKLSAKWSNDLEEQIRDLKASKYSFHEA
jgi:hypothetical protein